MRGGFGTERHLRTEETWCSNCMVLADLWGATMERSAAWFEDMIVAWGVGS